MVRISILAVLADRDMWRRRRHWREENISILAVLADRDRPKWCEKIASGISILAVLADRDKRPPQSWCYVEAEFQSSRSLRTATWI